MQPLCGQMFMYVQYGCRCGPNFVSMDESIIDYSIISCNVRGLNCRAKQEEVKQII
jgi:hypothetical protein